MPNPLIKRIQHTIFQYTLFQKNDKIVLAVSGGPDSVFMLDIFSKLKKKYALELVIAHVNYGLRGKDSDKDEELVKKLAKKYNWEIFVHRPEETRHASSLLKARKMPAENKLRDIRYEFFEEIRQRNKFNCIAVAHNLDDQVETHLMRIIRGAGLRGLSAMRYKSNSIIRPLLNITREEIKRYLKESHLPYRIDKTNRESVYLRNKIRNRLIPYLEKNFNPQIKQTIFHSIETIADDYDLISQLASQEYAKNKNLSVNQLKKLHPALQKRVLHQALSKIKPHLKDIESAHLKEILKIISSTKNKRQVVTLKGLKITRIGDKLKIEEAK